MNFYATRDERLKTANYAQTVELTHALFCAETWMILSSITASYTTNDRKLFKQYAYTFLARACELECQQCQQ